MKLTLDWNCVIEVEEGRPQAEHVSDLINSHRKCHFAVALLAALGWQDLPLVPMPVVWGLSYFAFCFFVEDGDAFERDMNALWQVIASTIPSEPSEHLPVGMKLTDDVIQSEALSK